MFNKNPINPNSVRIEVVSPEARFDPEFIYYEQDSKNVDILDPLFLKAIIVSEIVTVEHGYDIVGTDPDIYLPHQFLERFGFYDELARLKSIQEAATESIPANDLINVHSLLH